MNMEKKQSYHEKVAQTIIEQLKQGTAPWQKPWIGGEYMPHNPITGTRYKSMNSLWLMAQNKEDPRWMTYKQAQGIGAQVKKGERGTVIEYWKLTEERPKLDKEGREIIGEDGKPEKVTVKLERPKVMHFVVFNGSQIDGLPPLEAKQITWDVNKKAEEILENSGAVIKHSPGNRAFYRPSDDSITLPKKEQFPSEEGYYSTALHELGHWTGHESRLNRDLNHPFGSEGYAKEELRAEIASMMLGQELGITHDPSQHVSYVGSWIKVLQDDATEIFRAAADAEKIQKYVMNFAQTQEIEQATKQMMTISEKQNIDDATLQEERNIISHVENGSIGTLIGEKRTQEIITLMADDGQESIFWQRHEKPESEQFSQNLQQAIQMVNEAAYDLTDNTQMQSQDLPQLDDKEIKIVSDEKMLVLIPFEDKDEAKALGAKWDKDEKSWYIPPGVNQTPFEKWINSPVNQAQSVTDEIPATEKILIDVPFKEKNDARALGARWDKEEKSWYIPEGVNTVLFERWRQEKQEILPEENPADIVIDEQTEQVVKEVQQQQQQEKAQEPVLGEGVSRVYLAVPFEDKDKAKALGARWDKANKSWFMSSDNPNLNNEVVYKWKPENLPAAADSPAMTPQEEFAEKLQELGCIVDKGHPFMDGQKHRIETVGDKKGEKSGFYVGYMDGHPAGYIKNNRTGQEEKWKAKGYSLSPEEKAKLKAEAAQKLKEREENKLELQQKAVERIKYYMKDYRALAEGETTPYLKAKGIQAQPGIMTDKDGKKTFIPVYNIAGELKSMQYINEDGTKRFAKDSQQEGCLHVIGTKDLKAANTIILAEGYATAATINEVTDDTVACVATFNSGNLPLVAKELGKEFPNKQFIIAGDDDLAVKAKQGFNPGREKALEAGSILNCKVVLPIFAPGEQLENSKEFTDFNDLAQKSKFGRDGLAKQINEKINAVKQNSELNDLAIKQEQTQGEKVELTQQKVTHDDEEKLNHAKKVTKKRSRPSI